MAHFTKKQHILDSSGSIKGPVLSNSDYIVLLVAAAPHVLEGEQYEQYSKFFEMAKNKARTGADMKLA